MKYFFILLAVLAFSAGYILIKERSAEEYSAPSAVFFDSKTEMPDLTGSSKNQGGIIVFDIPGLTADAVSDSSLTPFLYKFISGSKVYSSTFNLSTDRTASLRSFIECLPPYKANDSKEPFLKYKKAISGDLRNGSLFQTFASSGYRVRFFASDQAAYDMSLQYINDSLVFSGSKENVITEIYKSIQAEPDAKYIYISDLGSGFGKKDHLKDIDILLGMFISRIRERHPLEPTVMLISTGTKINYEKTLTVLSGKGLEASSDSTGVCITDMSKTLLTLFKIKYPAYFGGYDIVNDEESGRDYFAGSNGDTLILFDEDFVYKKLKYSEKYAYYSLKNRTDETKKNIGINEKFHDLLPSYFGGDYIKSIIFGNRTDKPGVFNVSIKSKRRFAAIGDLKEYYSRSMTGGRYETNYSFRLEPGKQDTLLIYYSALHQDFSYSFNDSYSISYGGAGINAGRVKNFEENSYYGMKYYEDILPLFDGWDIRIFNSRINY
jgi:hypothetical protein